MEIVGIICEYNPFHNGHNYHIQKAKKLFPNSLIILCLNGYFLQRGEVSLLSKEQKTKIALEHNVDLVIELPLFYGTQSADYFAEASVTLLNALGVTHLVFGSEKKDISYLKNIASQQLKQDFSIIDDNSGLSYPARINKTLQENEKIEPNNLLAISYIKAILKNKFCMIPVPIKRTNSYHDLSSNKSIISASNIRNKISQNIDISPYLPSSAQKNILNINQEKLFEIIKYKILTERHLEKFMDVTEGLEFKLKKEINKSQDLSELINNLKSRRYTYNRLNRMLIHILLGIEKEKKFIEVPYIHILGFNKHGKEYLKREKNNFILPTKIIYTHKIYQYEIVGARIYDMLTNTNSSSFDLKNSPIIYIEH